MKKRKAKKSKSKFPIIIIGAIIIGIVVFYFYSADQAKIRGFAFGNEIQTLQEEIQDEQGKFILDGANPKDEWMGYIPYEHVLKYQNPESGFVSSANQHPVNKNYPYYYYSFNYEMYRGRRLIERLESIEKVTFEILFCPKMFQQMNF